MPSSREHEWKQFYREQYSQDWEQFAASLANQEYHLRYQEACLEKVREANPRTILEVGVGRGDLLIQLAGESRELFGCDISEGNLRAASRRLNELDCTTAVSHADAERLPFRDGAFDAVYALSVLWYLPNPAKAVAEICRVTRPGGVIVFDMLNAAHITSAAYHISRIVARWLGRERGRTKLASPGAVRSWVKPYCSEIAVYGSYVLLPAGLPIIGEKANFYRFAPDWAGQMTESPLKYLAHKLVVVATRA
ncbi:MAG: methyltransferase domain-containing protein [bacterium]